MPDGICPLAVWRPTNNFGYPQGTRGQNLPEVFFDHIMAGWKATLDNAAWREANGVGVHFGIGKDGSASQYTNIFDGHWGNGVSGSKVKYDRSNPHLAGWERLPGAVWITVPYVGTTAYALMEPLASNPMYRQNIPNCRSISFEHEGQPGDVWTEAMIETTIKLKLWCIEELQRVRGYSMDINIDLLCGHYMIDAVNRSSCPGPQWPRQRILRSLQAGTAGGIQEDDMADQLWKDTQTGRYAQVGVMGRHDHGVGVSSVVAALMRGGAKVVEVDSATFDAVTAVDDLASRRVRERLARAYKTVQSGSSSVNKAFAQIAADLEKSV